MARPPRVTIEPYTATERRSCPFCGKPVRPRFPDTVKLTPAEAETYRTNRRVVHWRTEYAWLDPDGHSFVHWSRGGTLKRVPYKIILTFVEEDPARWGVDGIFCTGTCAEAFGRAAYRAGYRVARKGAA